MELRIQKSTLLIFVSILLSGCQTVSQSQESLKNNPAIKYEFNVNRSYQSVYRDAKRVVYDEFSGMDFFGVFVDSDIYTDTKTAFVSCYGNSPLTGKSTHLYVEIEEISPALSKVSIYSSKAYKEVAQRIKSVCETN